METGFRRAGTLFAFLVICILQFSTISAQTCNGDPNSMVLDDDFDGYSNGDETQNGTDKCSSLSVPADFDGDYLSDLVDSDDDNDGIADVTDKFAMDKQNGLATSIPVYYKFQNPANGGIGNSGFTGLMTNGGVNYSSLYNPADIVIGGASNKFTVNNISSGDALGATNTQKNGFQFGVNAGAFPFNYTISSRVMTPFLGITPADFQSMGMFMGTGDQDNYLKITCTSNGGIGGIEVVKEVAGVVTSNMYSAAVVGSSQVNFYFTINRTNNTVQPAYSVNGGTAVNVGSAIAVPASWLSGVQAIGLISTSRGATAFSASWDYIAVQPIDGNGQWQTVNMNNSCVARHDCGFVQTGSRFELLGGHGVVTNYTENYNFLSKLWATSGDVRDATPPEIITHSQAVQVNGFIYMACAFGGSFPNDVPLDKVYMYDPAYNYWYSGMAIPVDRRRGAAASVVYNEKVYVIGGLKNGHTGGWTNYLDKFDPYTHTWTVLPDAPHERDHFQAIVKDGKIYCIGGRKTGFGATVYDGTVAETDVYDIENQTWSTLPSPECDIPTQRAGAAVALIGDEIFVIGGENSSQTAALNTTEAFNVKTKTWRTVASLNTGRQGTQAIVDNYAIYIVGGTSNRGESPDLGSMEVFYPYGQTTPTGTAYMRPVLGMSPSDHLDFGNVAIGTTSTKTVTIKNTVGTQAMIIKSIHLAQQSMTNLSISYPYAIPFALDPGDSIQIQVTFQPNSTSDFIGTLYISNTGVNGDNLDFAITGKGVTQQPAVRINCAGPQFTNGASNVFAQDAFTQPGTTKISTVQAISGTTDDVLFQTARSGSAFSYNIPVQSNTYTVNLYFAEIESNMSAGVNVFDVKIEGSTKISALDLFTEAGMNTAYMKTFTIPVTDQMMNLDFIASAGNARISAIELIPAAVTQGVLTSVPNPLEFPATDLNSNSAPITVTLTNTGVASLNITSVSITGANAANFTQTYGLATTSLIPGATKTFTVVFNPTAAGIRTASLSIAHTGANAPMNIALKGTGTSTVTPCGHFVEQNGLLVMEVESQKPAGYWTPNTAIPNYTGDDYYTWQGPDYFFEKGNGMMRYEFEITTPGKYRFRLRNRHPGPDPAHFNDIWVRFPDHGATFEKNGQVMQESGTGWWIGSQATKDAWTYNIYGMRSTYWSVEVEFQRPGIYYVDLSGRVENFSIDRIVLYREDMHTEWEACGSNPAQSPWVDCPTTPLTWYRDKDLDDYGDPNVTVQSTTKPGAGWILNNNQDCDDNQATVYPGAPEILDGRDNDCDGVVDDGALLNALNINCGGSEYTAVSGDLFQSDRLYKPSSTSVKFFNNTGDILNTDDDNLFKSERFNSQFTTSFTYNMKAAPGKFYKVSLYFAEQGTVTAPGQRVFNVALEDSMVLSNFDIISTAGYKTAYVYDAYVYLRDSTLNIKFTDVVGKAKINAIKAAIQPNVPPTFKVTPVFLTLNEDFTGTKNFVVTADPVLAHEALQAVTYSLSPATCSYANVSFNTATGQASFTALPNGNGVQVFTITANDGQAENNIATKTFQFKVLPVNDKPAFTMSGNVNVNKNFAGTIDVTANPTAVPVDEQSQVVTYSLSPASVGFANIAFNSATGKVSITSMNEMYGTQLFTVTANDGMASNNTATATFTLTINNINYPPTLDAIADMSIDEDAAMQTVNLAGITPGLGEMQAMTMTVASDNAALIATPSLSYTSPNATGTLSFIAAANKSGVANITVTVSDGSLTFSRTFKVTVNEVNDAPLMDAISDVMINEDASLQTVNLSGINAGAFETQTLSVYAVSDNAALIANPSVSYTSANANGSISFAPVANQSGVAHITVTVSDGSLSLDRMFTVTVNAINDAPAFALSGDVTVSEDFVAAQQVSVIVGFIPSDEMSQVVSYSLSPASVAFANVSFNSATGEVTIASIANASGSQLFTVTANDGQSQNNIAAQSFTLTVLPVNDVPAFTVSGNIDVIEGIYSSATETVTPGFVPSDEMSQPVTYSISPVSVSIANVSINSATGEVTITPIADQFGSQLFTITANDGQSQNNTASQSFTLTIEEGNNPPSFTLSGDLNLNEDFSGAQHAAVTADPVRPFEAGQIVTYSLSPALVSFATVAFDDETGEVTVTAIANAYGSQQFTITADDHQNRRNTYSQDFTVTVNSVNDAPAFTLSGDVTVDEDFAAVEHVDVVAGFVPANEMSQVVTYSLSPASVSIANVSINSSTGIVTINSVADASGVQLFTVTANDGQSQNNTYSATFMLTVNAVNDQPTLNAINNPGAVLEDSGMRTISLSGISAGGSENQTLTVTVSSDHPALFSLLNVNYTSPATIGSIEFQPAADQWGAATVTVTVDDGQTIISRTFMITVTSVNDEPKFLLSNNSLTLDEDFAGTQTISATLSPAPLDEMGQTVTYSLSPMSVSFANIAFNSATGEIQITAVADASGSRTFTVMADDGQSQNNVHYETFVLTVNPVNDVPVFTVTPAATVFKNFISTVSFTSTPGAVPTDEASQVVTYSLSPASVSFANVAFNSASGAVTITSINNMIGSQQFTIAANDQQSINNLYAQQFTFSVIDTNYQPTLDAIADPAAIDEDAAMQTISLSGITPGFNEVQTVTVSATSSNPALIPNPIVSYTNPAITGSLSYAPVANQSGVAVITVKVDDGQGSNNFIVRTFTATVNAVNDVPAMDAIADMSISEDAAIQSVPLSGISAGPSESQTLTITAVSDNQSLIANPTVTYSSPTASGMIQFMPAANQNGSAVITVSVNDGQLSVSQSFTVTVTPVNDAPVISNVYKSGQEDKAMGFAPFNFTDKYNDIDGGALSKIQVVSLPPNGTLTLNGAAVNAMDEIATSAIGDLVYQPGDEFSGVDSFLWNGFDGQVYAAMSAKVYMNVNDVNDRPEVVNAIADITVNEDAPAMMDYADLGVVFHDIEDGANMTYSVNNSNQTLLDVTVGSDHKMDITFNANAHGNAVIILTATDHVGAFAMDTFNVTVNSVEDVPSVFTLLTPADGSQIVNPSSLEFTWENSSDGDGDAITYTLTINGHQLNTEIGSTSSTSMLMSNISLFTKDSTYTWFVTASDGDDVTTSAIHSFRLVDSTTAIHDPSVLVNEVEAYPNPFNTSINIGYTLKVEAKVSVKIYNFLGQVIKTVSAEQESKGQHKIEWNGSDAAPGVYFYEISMKTNTMAEDSFTGKIVKN